MTAQLTVLSQTDLSRAQELERLTAENANLRTQVRTEQQDRDKLFTQTLELTDQMNKLRGFKQQLEERNRAVDGSGDSIQGSRSPPRESTSTNHSMVLRRSVTATFSRSIAQANWCSFRSATTRDLRKGHFLEVTRGGRYVGKLKVRNTEPDRAVAEILEDYSEGILQEGDRVDTTIE